MITFYYMNFNSQGNAKQAEECGMNRRWRDKQELVGHVQNMAFIVRLI